MGWDEEPRQHFIWCTRCEKQTTAYETGLVAKESYIGFKNVTMPARQTILACCEGCKEPSLFIREENAWDSSEWDDLVRVWPNPVRPLSEAIPVALRTEQAEARKCFDAKAYTATVVMVRRTLEGICDHQGIKEKVLQKSLLKLKENDLIDRRLFEWASELRVLGNEGAHYTGRLVSREDAADAVDFSEAMLDYMYVLTAKFNGFQKRRKAKALSSQEEAKGDAAELAEEPPF